MTEDDGTGAVVVATSAVVEGVGGLVLVVTSVVDVAAVEDGASVVVGEIVVVAGSAVVAGAVVEVDATEGRSGGGATTQGAVNATGR